MNYYMKKKNINANLQINIRKYIEYLVKFNNNFTEDFVF